MEPISLTDHKNRVLAYISPEQRDLLLFFRGKMPYGRAVVSADNGEPTIIKEALGTVKLGADAPMHEVRGK